MPERWRDELAKLDDLGAPHDVLEDARDREPGHDADRRSRLAAGLVAALVFLAVAGSFAWQAVEGEPSVTTTASPAEQPTATQQPTTEPATLEPIVVTSPADGAEVSPPVTIEGSADVFEGTVSIEIRDSVNNIIARSFATATCGNGCRGDFSVQVPYEVNTIQPGEIFVFEESPEDGSRQHTVRIPVTLSPGPDDPIAGSLEGEWTDPNGDPVPDGLPSGPLVLHTFEGAEHCGWTSMTFLHLSWPVGAEDGPFRQYARDPMDLFAEVPFVPAATLPADANETGYQRGDWELWVADSDSDGIYLVRGDPAGGGTVERWPRTSPILCD
jgi:hypothetical protein